MKPQTAKQINAPQVGESELRPSLLFEHRRFFEDMMNHFGYKIVDVTPPKGFTAKAMRRIRRMKDKRRKSK